MKKNLKSIFVVALSLVMVFSLAACGEDEEAPAADDTEETFDISQVEGVTWGIGSINGVEYEEHCKKYGLDPETSNSFWTIEGDTVIMDTGDGGLEFPIEVTGKGFIVSDPNGNEIDVTYDAETDTLNYSYDNGKAVLEAQLVVYE